MWGGLGIMQSGMPSQRDPYGAMTGLQGCRMQTRRELILKRRPWHGVYSDNAMAGIGEVFQSLMGVTAVAVVGSSVIDNLLSFRIEAIHVAPSRAVGAFIILQIDV